MNFIKITSENAVLWTGMKGASAEGRKKQARCWNKFSMTWGFGPGLFVIPNLFQDLSFGFKNLDVKAPPCGRSSLFEQFRKLQL